MAVASNSASQVSNHKEQTPSESQIVLESPSKQKKVKKDKKKMDDVDGDVSKKETKTTKRTPNPGVRVIHGRIYDSQNGKTCHQCRQKTRDFVATCKNQRNNKPCPLVFCHACLLNRYGEKAEDVQRLESWSCPKCRGICNCSLCRKKHGLQPTGALTRTAKASGCSSVSELLSVKGPDNFAYVKKVKDTGASEKEALIASPRKSGKENSYEGNLNINVENNTKNVKQEELGKMQNGSLEEGGLSKCRPVSDEKPPKKIKRRALKKHISQEDEAVSQNDSNPDGDKKLAKKKRKGLDEMQDGGISEGTLLERSTKKPKVLKERKSKEDAETNMKNLCRESKDVDPDIPLPNGTELTTVAGIELPAKDAGNALQFLEFCATFGKILNLKKGQANVILQELMNGRGRQLRREQYSAAVQLHVHLLSLIQKEPRPQTSSPSCRKKSWWLDLKDYISESQKKFNPLPFDCFGMEVGEYDSLDTSTKLRLLNYLCDDVLETAKFRDWIDDQNIKFAEKAKQAKEKVIAAKDKAKSLKQKLIDDAAKAALANNGAPLSISENDEIVRQIRSEADQAHAEMLDSMGMVPKKKQRHDAVRTEPVLLDVDGIAYWRLNGYYDKSNILVQELGSGDDSAAQAEKWLAFDLEQEKVIEERISSREKMLRAQTATKKVSSKSSGPSA